MPRKKTKQKPRVVDSVGSHEQLADALGVHRNTIGAWAKRGAPAGPPYSIVAWHAWAKTHGYKPQAPREQALRFLTNPDDNDDGWGPEQKPSDATDLPGTTPYDELWLTGRMKLSTAREREQLKADMLVVEQREIQVGNAKLEQEKVRGTLIERDQATAAAAIVFKAFVREGELLAEAVVQALAEQPLSVKALVGNAVRKAWTGVLSRVGDEAPDARG
jgi:hypothetical protein